MPWKIVNLDYDCERPHLHMKDPGAPIHLRSYFDEKRVEIALGDDEPELCFVRAVVSADDVTATATQFQTRHVRILQSIFGSLDVEPEERDRALGWMLAQLTQAGRPRDDDARFFPGNVASFPAPTGWPYDLTDAALLDSLRDSEAIPSTRLGALRREAERRGLREAERTPPRGPEVFRRR